MKKCPVCQTNSTKAQTLFVQKPFSIKQCQNCEFGWIYPTPSEKDLFEIYQKDYHTYITDDEFMADAEYKLKRIQSLMPRKSSLLDFGTGLGHFVHLSSKQGYKATGYDISQEARDIAKKKFSLEIVSKPLKKSTFPENSFQTITSFDVIEHIVDFQSWLSYLHHWLKPDGRLILTTPDFDSWDAKLMGKKWYGYTRIPQHVNYFGRKSVSQSLVDQGYEVEIIETIGFVRSLGYLAHQISNNKVLHAFLDNTKLSPKQIYLPMTDMLVVARKVA